MRSRRRLSAASAVVVALVLTAAPASGAAPDPVQRTAARAQAPLSQLVPARPVSVPGGGVIERYRQRAGGLPVLGADAVIADPPGAAPTLVSDHTVAGLRPAGAAKLSRAAAIARALRTTAASRLRDRTTARLAVDPAGGSPVWQVLIASGAPLADYEVLIGATDGSIVRITDLLRRATATAFLYVPNPVVQRGTYSGLKDREDRDSGLLTSLRLPVTLDRLTSPKGCLSGQYVTVGIGPRRTPACDASFDFTSITRHSDKFEALMAYGSIDRTRAYIDGLGLTRAYGAKPQRVRVDAIADDNSFFSPKERGITYGSGGVDDAEDADVIIHEYGHALQDQAVHLFGSRLQGASIGEGWGDYLAAAMSFQATGGNPAFDPCMFEWDAVSYTANECARRTDKAITLKAANRHCADEPHCIGEAWSGALWELRGGLGLDTSGLSIVDRVVLESNFMLARKATFRDAARALLAADQLLYGGANAAGIGAEMIQRGFCPASGC